MLAWKVPETETHWIAESGVIDMFVFLGPAPKDVFHQYAMVTGEGVGSADDVDFAGESCAP